MGRGNFFFGMTVHFFPAVYPDRKRNWRRFLLILEEIKNKKVKWGKTLQ